MVNDPNDGDDEVKETLGLDPIDMIRQRYDDRENMMITTIVMEENPDGIIKYDGLYVIKRVQEMDISDYCMNEDHEAYCCLLSECEECSKY